MSSSKKTLLPSAYAEPPGTPDNALPAVLRRRLDGVRRRYLAVAWVEGTSLLVSALVGLVAVQVLADGLLDLPRGVRAIFLVADLVALGWLVRLGLVHPWRLRLTSATAALRAEKTFPALRGALISAVQLSQGADSNAVSPALLSAGVTQATRATDALDFTRIVPAARATRLALATVVLLAVSVSVIALNTKLSGLLLSRLALSTEPLPTRTRVVPMTQEVLASIGTRVELSARASGELPRSGRVRVIYTDGKQEDFPVVADPAEPDLFKLIVPTLRIGLSYRFYLGDGRGPAFAVRALTPPAIASLNAEEVFPDYTGLQALPRLPANLTLLGGSRLRLHLRSTLPLKSATLQPHGAGPPVVMPLTADGQGASGELPIPADNLTGFSIALVSVEGASSQADTVYRVTVIRDQPPVITLVLPVAERETITLRASPLIELQAADDFGLTRVALCYQVAPPGAGDAPDTTGEVMRIAFPVEGPTGLQIRSHPWKLSSIEPRLIEGSVVTYWIEAFDNNTATGPGFTETRRQQFVIVSPAAKREEILRRIGENSNVLKDLSDTQRKLGEAIDSLLPSSVTP